MEKRIRERISYASGGAVTYPPSGVSGPFPYLTRRDWTLDYIKKSKDPENGYLTPPSDFDSFKTKQIPPFLDYRLSSSIDGILYYNASGIPGVPAGGLNPDTPPLGWEYLEGSTASLTSRLLSDTNPFNYSVSVPVMIAELVEAGSLLKLAANNFFSLAGSAHLNWLFGWEATIGDIRKLASITIAIESKIKEFNEIVEKGGLRRRKFLKRGQAQGMPFTIPTHSLAGLGTWYGTATANFTTKVWGSVRWVPNKTSPIDLSKLTSFNEACKVVLDLRYPDASTIWEAIPFSWLVDYFLNVGDTLRAIEDSDKVLPTDICIMRHRRIVTDTIGIPWDEYDPPWIRKVKITNGLCEHDWKLRSVIHPDDAGDLLSFGIMSKAQATNLIALLLSLTRFKR